ncbi:precorrin-2 C(20)-methyltransferase [Tessaracoccus sp. OH4464_COT-324]|uniref:precorrin-2 C(20)-methyltransferase n=1 Tax=Tessaracoccus sp. OH4464_COT-324 TaxID=2491059 RepID=UPI000F63DB4A|nr:precorrin-2 C(20)-methyltransferase [Tessaracoccus sp. OH4464_COT-324]RRD45985.1 precorrin-2 C(20)-methyltransferase [Tessaracoccus sp. OH4464_COT-324]
MTSKRALIGVGVGPGDPELVTVKALNRLAEADVILVPSTEARAGSVGRAEEIVLSHLPHKAAAIERIPFSMAERRGVGEQRATAWELSADAAVSAFEAGARTVAFATVGDASVFSTFSYLCDLVTSRVDVEPEVIPGITAMQALAARSRTPLAEGQEVLSLVPWTVGVETLERVCEVSDTVVIYKGGRELTQLRAALERQGRLDSAVLGTDLGLDTEAIVALADANPRAPYFSTVLSAPERTTTGGRL